MVYFQEYAAKDHPDYKKRNENNEWICKCVTRQDIETALKTISETSGLMNYKLYSDEEVTEVAKYISNEISTYNENERQNKKLRQRIEKLKKKQNGVISKAQSYFNNQLLKNYLNTLMNIILGT